MKVILDSVAPGDYAFNVDGSVLIIGGKIPDFVNINGQKKVVELYGDFWHKGENPDDRKSLFRGLGYDALIVWESELKNRESVIQKVKEFHCDLH